MPASQHKISWRRPPYTFLELSLSKILDQSLRDTYTAYTQENPKDKASLSNFCTQRPKHILSYTKTPFIQCVCEICQNPVAKMKAINKHLHDKIGVDGGLDRLINMTLSHIR